MIFVTVGTQLPFDRLLQAMDDWAEINPDHHVIAQTGVSNLQTSRIETRPFVNASEFKTLVKQADVLVAHAGMGSILTAVELGKPVIIMPRRAGLGEHRNDHQLATAERLGHLENLQVVENARELPMALRKALNAKSFAAMSEMISDGHRRLVGEVRNFIADPAWASATEDLELAA